MLAKQTAAVLAALTAVSTFRYALKNVMPNVVIIYVETRQ